MLKKQYKSLKKKPGGSSFRQTRHQPRRSVFKRLGQKPSKGEKSQLDKFQDLADKFGIDKLIDRCWERGELDGTRIYEVTGDEYTWEEWRESGEENGEDLVELLNDWYNAPSGRISPIRLW